MGRFQLCKEKTAEHPFAVELLSVRVYTMEELCWVMEHNLFLLDESWINPTLFRWLSEELEETELSDQLSKTFRRSKDIYDCAELIFVTGGCYAAVEIRRLSELLGRMRGKNQMERKKMRADYFLSEKRYRHAALSYLELLQPEQTERMTEELQGKILHNLGVCYARLFLFPEAAQMFAAAYKKNRAEESRLCYLYAMNYNSEDEPMAERELDIHFGTMKEAFSRFTDVSDREQYYQERKRLSDASHSFNWKGRQEELLGRWVQEYNLY